MTLTNDDPETPVYLLTVCYRANNYLIFVPYKNKHPGKSTSTSGLETRSFPVNLISDGNRLGTIVFLMLLCPATRCVTERQCHLNNWLVVPSKYCPRFALLYTDLEKPAPFWTDPWGALRFRRIINISIRYQGMTSTRFLYSRALIHLSYYSRTPIYIPQ